MSPMVNWLFLPAPAPLLGEDRFKGVLDESCCLFNSYRKVELACFGERPPPVRAPTKLENLMPVPGMATCGFTFKPYEAWGPVGSKLLVA